MRQAGIRQDGDLFRRVVAQVAHRVVHLTRPCGAVQANDIDVVNIQNCQCRVDFRSEQHRAAFLQRHLNLERNASSGSCHRIECRCDCDLGLQDVLRGFDEQYIDSGLNQCRHLLDE